MSNLKLMAQWPGGTMQHAAGDAVPELRRGSRTSCTMWMKLREVSTKTLRPLANFEWEADALQIHFAYRSCGLELR